MLKKLFFKKRQAIAINEAYEALCKAFKESEGGNRENAFFNDAIRQYSEILKHDPTNKQALQGRVLSYISNYQIKEALRDITKYIRHFPDIETGYLVRSDIYLATRKDDDALVDLEKALDINPKNVHIYVCLARFYAKKSDIWQSQKYMDMAIAINSKEAERLRKIYAKEII